jgi:putative hydrolase of the HAD superfamily
VPPLLRSARAKRLRPKRRSHLANPAISGYRAVLLDALGTLVELQPPWPLLRGTLAARHGIEISETDAKRAMLAEMAYYRAHHREGSDRSSLADLRERCALVLREQLPQAASLGIGELKEALLDALRFSPFPDAAPTLATLRAAGVRLAVVSNWDCSLRSVLAELGLAAAVDAVVVSAEVGAAKPDPAIFEAALRELRRDPGEAVFVGDSLETDVLGAREAGLRALLLDRTGADRAPADVERIFSLQELAESVEARDQTR